MDLAAVRPHTAGTELPSLHDYERHIRRVRRRNGERRAALIDALARFMPGETELVGTEAGLQLAQLIKRR